MELSGDREAKVASPTALGEMFEGAGPGAGTSVGGAGGTPLAPAASGPPLAPIPFGGRVVTSGPGPPIAPIAAIAGNWPKASGSGPPAGRGVAGTGAGAGAGASGGASGGAPLAVFPAAQPAAASAGSAAGGPTSPPVVASDHVVSDRGGGRSNGGHVGGGGERIGPSASPGGKSAKFKERRVQRCAAYRKAAYEGSAASFSLNDLPEVPLEEEIFGDMFCEERQPFRRRIPASAEGRREAAAKAVFAEGESQFVNGLVKPEDPFHAGSFSMNDLPTDFWVDPQVSNEDVKPHHSGTFGMLKTMGYAGRCGIAAKVDARGHCDAAEGRRGGGRSRGHAGAGAAAARALSLNDLPEMSFDHEGRCPGQRSAPPRGHRSMSSSGAASASGGSGSVAGVGAGAGAGAGGGTPRQQQSHYFGRGDFECSSEVEQENLEGLLRPVIDLIMVHEVRLALGLLQHFTKSCLGQLEIGITKQGVADELRSFAANQLSCLPASVKAIFDEDLFVPVPQRPQQPSAAGSRNMQPPCSEPPSRRPAFRRVARGPALCKAVKDQAKEDDTLPPGQVFTVPRDPSWPTSHVKGWEPVAFNGSSETVNSCIDVKDIDVGVLSLASEGMNALDRASLVATHVDSPFEQLDQ